MLFRSIETIKEANNDDIDFSENIERFMEKEPLEINESLIVDKYTVSMPMFYIGYKDEFVKREARESLKLEIITDMLFDIIFSESGDLHQNLYNEGLIVGGISGGYLSQKDYAYAVTSGASKDPREVKKRIDEYIENLKKTGIDSYEFEINKKKKIGGFLKSFDSINYIANNFLNYMFRGINFLEYFEVLKEVEIEDINKRLYEFFKEDNSVLSIVEPKETTREFNQ